MLAVLSVVAMIASPAAAQGLSASDMAFAFGGKASAPAAVQQTARAAAPKAAEPVAIASARGMTQTEMEETEGAVAPLVAVGVMTGFRFIVKRYVTQRVATRIVRKGKENVMAKNRQQAAAIARNASKGRNRGIREFHPGPGKRFTHYHSNPRSGSHVWYGRSR